MFGELILNITARVDGLLGNLNKARQTFDQVVQQVSGRADAMSSILRRKIAQVEQDIQSLRNRMKQGLVPRDVGQTGIDSLNAALKDYKQQLKTVEAAQKAHNRRAKAVFENIKAQVNAQLQGMVNMGSMMRQIGANIRMAGVGMLAVAVALGAAWRDLSTTGADFEQTMSVVVSVIGELQGVGEEASTQFQALSDEIMELGRTTNFTASQVATAAQFLGQAGFSAQEATDALAATVNLARAGMLDLARASEITADMVNAYTLQATDAARVTDVFAKAQAQANTTVEQLGNAFSFAAPVAASLGQNVEESAVALALLANNSIKSSRAGTGYAQILSGLIRKTEDTTELMLKYGSSFEAVDPTINSIIDIIKEFSRVGVSAADVMEFFGERAGRAMLALMNTPTSQIDEMGDAIENSFGEGLAQATIRWDNLNGSIRVFVSRLEAIKLEIFERIKGSIRSVVDAAADMLQSLLDILNDPEWAGLVEPIMAIVAAFTALLAVGGAVLVGLGTLMVAWGGAQVVMASMAISASASAEATAGAAIAAELATAALTQLGVTAGMTAAEMLAVAEAGGLAQAELTALAATAAGGGAAGAGAAKAGLFVTLRRQALSVLGVFKKVALWIASKWLPITVIVGAIVGVMGAWRESTDGLFESWQSFGSLAATVSDMFLSFVDSIKDGFNDITDVASRAMEWAGDWLGVFTPTEETTLWERFVGVFRSLAGVLNKVAVAFQPVLDALGFLTGAIFGLIGAVTDLLATGIVMLLEGIAISLEWIIDKASAVAEWFGIAGLSSENLENKLKRQTDAVNDLAKAHRDLIEGFSEESKVENKRAGELEEMVSLMQRRDQLNVRDMRRLAELKRKYADVENALHSLIASTNEEKIKFSEAAAAAKDGSTEKAQLTLIVERLTERTNRLMKSEESFNGLIIEGAAVVTEEIAALEKSADIKQRRNTIIREGTEALEAYNEAQAEFNELINDVADAQLNAHQRELKQIQERRDALTGLVEAQSKQLASQLALNNLRQDEQWEEVNAATDAWLNTMTDANATWEEQVVAHDKMRAAKEKLNRLQLEGNNLLAKQFEIHAQLADSEAALAAEEQKAQKQVSDKQTAILKKQEIQQAKLAGDKLLAAQLTAEAELEADRKRIEETFLLEDAASQKQKADALKNAEEIRDAKIAAALQAADEEAKKAEEAAEKEKQKKLKALDETRQSLEDKIAESLAKRVTSLREMVALTFTLMRLEAIKEARAREAAKRAASEAARVQRLAKIAEADPTNERKQAALLRAQQSARIEALMAGKKLTDAGLTAEAGQAVETLFTPQTAPSVQTVGGIFKVLEDSRLIQQNILDTLLSFPIAPGLGMQALALGGPGVGQGPLGADGLTNVTSTTENTSQVDVTINNSFDAEVAEAVVFDAIKNAGLNVV